MKIKLIAVMAVSLLLSQSVQAINLTDKTENIYKTLDEKVVPVKESIYPDSDKKLLINQDLVHEFTKDNEYIQTKKVTKEKIEYFFLPAMLNEVEKYTSIGFTGIPNKHVSVVPPNAVYYTQQENKNYPMSSCCPTTVAMYLGMFGKNFTPDEISTNCPNMSDGCSYPEAFLSVKSNLFEDIKLRYTIMTEAQDIKDFIDNGEPVMASVFAGRYDSSKYKERICKFVEKSQGNIYHAILITGYLEIEDELYLEIYDPSSYSKVNGRPEGQGRYMNFKDFKKFARNPLYTMIIEEEEK